MGPPSILGISGFRGSGKTTLIAKLLLELNKDGYRIAVIKHQHEPVQNDRPGSDIDQFYQAGADVLGYDGQAIFFKSYQESTFEVQQALKFFGDSYDLIMVEGYKKSSIPKIWLLRPGEMKPPAWAKNIMQVLDWNSERLDFSLRLLRNWLLGDQRALKFPKCHLQTTKSLSTLY